MIFWESEYSLLCQPLLMPRSKAGNFQHVFHYFLPPPAGIDATHEAALTPKHWTLFFLESRLRKEHSCYLLFKFLRRTKREPVESTVSIGNSGVCLWASDVARLLSSFWCVYSSSQTLFGLPSLTRMRLCGSVPPARLPHTEDPYQAGAAAAASDSFQSHSGAKRKTGALTTQKNAILLQE